MLAAPSSRNPGSRASRCNAAGAPSPTRCGPPSAPPPGGGALRRPISSTATFIVTPGSGMVREGELNPHGCDPLDPKSSASANSATLARSNSLWNGLAGRRHQGYHHGPRGRAPAGECEHPQDWYTRATPLRYRRAECALPSGLQPRIESVAHSVAEEVEAQHGEKDGEAREGAEPGRLLEIAPAHGQHDAPRRRGGCVPIPRKDRARPR